MTDQPPRPAPPDGGPTSGPSGPKQPQGPPGNGTRRTDQPRRVRAGLRLRSREGAISHSGVSRRWAAVFEALIPIEEMQEGLRYARLGQTVSIEIAPGGVRARVQGRAPRPYEVRIKADVFDDGVWRRVIEAMADEAMYLVKLMAGEFPDGFDALLEREGVRILPSEDGDDVVISCTCPGAGRCRHVAAVVHLLAERIVKEPLLLMTVRGLPPEQALERLRHVRTIQAHGVATAHADPLIPETQMAAAPLADCLESFWRQGPSLSAARELEPGHHVDHALLRRLGPSPLSGKFPLVGLLASIYDHVAEYTDKLREDCPQELTE